MNALIFLGDPTPMDGAVSELINAAPNAGAMIITVLIFLKFVREIMGSYEKQIERLNESWNVIATDYKEAVGKNTEALGKVVASLREERGEG